MYKSLQGCRAVAALLVVLHHLGFAMASDKYFGAAQFKVPFIAGDSGVEFFFVLSGFIITWAHFDEIGKPARLLKYLRKRVVRIYPTYWIIFGAVYLLAQASPALRSTVPHDYPTLLESLALVPQDRAIGGYAPVLLVAWTLQYEICFYALMAIFIASRTLGVLVCIPLFMNLGTCHAGGCSFPRDFFANHLILLFGLGASIAYCSKRSVPMRRPILVAALAAAAFIGYGTFEAVMGTGLLPVDRRLVYGLLSGVLIFALVRSEDTGQLRIQNRWMPLLGDASYALYLIHYPLISALCKLSILVGLHGRAGALIAYPLIICACIAAAVAFHVLIERRILRVLTTRKAAPALAHGVP